MNIPEWLLRILLCPVCREPLDIDADVLVHRDTGCRERYPIIDGIPRLVRGPARARLVAERKDGFGKSASLRSLAAEWSATGGISDPVVAGFDHEWRRHARVARREHHDLFRMYTDVVPPDAFSGDPLVLDAGCGAGRWAIEAAGRGARVIALDLGLSVEVAAENARTSPRVAAVQADLNDLPLRPGSVDWAYSLGVLHHLDRPGEAMARLASVVRPGGFLLVYLYYALDRRGAAYRLAFRGVDAVRRVTSRLPRAAVATFADAAALLVYWPLARTSRLLAGAGAKRIADALPLSFYRDLPFHVMRNDSLDRFGTRVEKRFSRGDFVRSLEEAGLRAIRVSDSPPYWHGLGSREGKGGQ